MENRHSILIANINQYFITHREWEGEIMPALIVTTNGILMKRIVSVKQAAEYSHRTVQDIKRSFPYDFIDCGSKGIGVDTKDLDRWIELQKTGLSKNELCEAIERL